MSACNCCSAPPCASPIIECKSVSASKSKCGFVNPADGKTYLKTTDSDGWTVKQMSADTCTVTFSGTQTVTVTGNPTGEGDFSLPWGTQSFTGSYTYITVKTRQANGSITYAYSGSASFLHSYDGVFYGGNSDGTGGGGPHLIVSEGCSSTVQADGSWSGTEFRFISIDGETVEDSSGPITGCPQYYFAYTTNTVPSSAAAVYENEYLTSDLISRTVAALPAWPETWSGSCSAFRNLSPDESSYSIRRFKWRLKHAPTGTCYLKAWIQKRFVPEGGGDPVITPLSPYIWTGTGNPCLADDSKRFDATENLITGSEFTVNEPESDGTIYIDVVKWSCVEGYEPDISDPENPQLSGYPDPAWTA